VIELESTWLKSKARRWWTRWISIHMKQMLTLGEKNEMKTSLKAKLYARVFILPAEVR